LRFALKHTARRRINEAESLPKMHVMVTPLDCHDFSGKPPVLPALCARGNGDEPMTFTRFEAVTRKNLQIRDALEEIEAILEASDFTMENSISY
jgi:hypothetical protein